MANYIGYPGAKSGGHHRQGLALVFAGDYHPNQPFTVVSRLQPSTTIDILAGPEDHGVPVIPRPDEYHGYVVRYLRFGTAVYGFLFSRELLRTGEHYRLVGHVNVFSGTLNLLSTPFERIGGSTAGNRR